VTIRRDGFIGYTLASGLQCNKLEGRRKKVRRYDTTRPWRSTQLRGSMKSRKERVRPKVGQDRMCIFIVWQDEMKMRCYQSSPGSPKYIFRLAHFTSISPVSPYTHCRSLTIYLEAVIELVWRCTWRLRCCKLRVALGGRDRSSVKRHWEAVLDRGRTCTGKPRGSELRDALWGCDRVSLEMLLQAMMERDWSSSWRRSMWREAQQQLRLYSLDNMSMWKCRELSTTCAERWESGWERKPVDLGMMLDLVYTILGVNSWLWHEEIERDDITSCS